MSADGRRPAPGEMTVLPWAGWEEVLAGVLLLAASAVVVLLLALVRPGTAERAEWQAWLDTRPSRGRDAAAGEAPEVHPPDTAESPGRPSLPRTSP